MRATGGEAPRTRRRRRAVVLATAGAACLSGLEAVPAQAVAYARITAEGASTTGSTSGEALLLERGAKFRIVRMASQANDRSLFPVVDRTKGERSTSSVRAQISANTGYARSELIVVDAAPMGRANLLEYSIFLPANQVAPKANQWWMFSQLKQTNCGVPPVAFELVSGTPSDKLQYKVLLRNDKLGWKATDSPHGLEIFRGPIAKGRWVHFKVEYRAEPARASRNYLRIWVDGVRTRARLPQGHAIGYTKACTEHPVPNSMNLRVGIYRGGVWWTTAGRTWFDNIRYGTP